MSPRTTREAGSPPLSPEVAAAAGLDPTQHDGNGQPDESEDGNGQPDGSQPGQQELCGIMVARNPKSDGTVRDPKPCVKTKGHDGDHSWRVYTQIDTKGVTADMLETYEAVPSDEIVEAVRETTRSAEQLIVDKHVKDSHESWVAAGKPKGFNDSPRKKYFTAPDQADAVRAMLRRAASLHGVHVRIAPPKKHTDGRTMIYWVAVDVKPKPPKPGTPAVSTSVTTPAG